MKRSQLEQIIREEFQGYSKYLGKTKGGTSDEFTQILTKIAKGGPQGDAERGNKILDKANPDNVARIIRGEKPMYEQASDIQSVELSYAFPGNRLYSIRINDKKVLDEEQAIQTIKDLTGLEVPGRGYFDSPQVSAIVAALKAKGIQASASEVDVS